MVCVVASMLLFLVGGPILEWWKNNKLRKQQAIWRDAYISGVRTGIQKMLRGTAASKQDNVLNYCGNAVVRDYLQPCREGIADF